MGVNSDEMSVNVQLSHLLVIFKSICGYFTDKTVGYVDVLLLL